MNEMGAIGTVGFIVAILIGLLNCFWGYRLFKIILAIWGFVVGALGVGAVLMSMDMQVALVILIAVLAGLLCAGLFVLLYYVGVFVVGAFLGALLGGAIGSLLSESIQWLPIVILAILGGILALVLQKIMIVLATSFGGGAAVVSGLIGLAGDGAGTRDVLSFTDLPRGATPQIGAGWLLLWLALGIAGTIVQLAVTAKKKEEAKAPLAPPPSAPPLQPR